MFQGHSMLLLYLEPMRDSEQLTLDYTMEFDINYTQSHKHRKNKIDILNIDYHRTTKMVRMDNDIDFQNKDGKDIDQGQ